MTPWITRIAAWSAAGRGVQALVDALERGLPLRAPVPYALPGLPSPFAALTGAGSASELLGAVVEEVLPPERPCGLVVATSSGDISGPFERWHRALVRGEPSGPEQPWRQAPARAIAARHGLWPNTTVSVACASGAAVFEVAKGWLERGLCERVVVAGVDLLSLYIHAGFGGLGALASEACRPFQPDRDGLVLGEGAAALLLESPQGAAGRPPLVALLGTGLSQDAVHLTAPDRTGNGLYRAARAALDEAGLAPDQIDAVSAHGTGTPFNDAMEARALSALFQGPAPLHAPKAVIGHTLGAAGVLEAVALVAMLTGASPPPPPAALAEDCSMSVRPAHDPRVGLSLNAAFGGVNAAVVFGPPERQQPASTPRRVEAVAQVQVEASALPLREVLPDAPLSLGRADTYVRGGVAALARLGAAGDDLAVVLSSETNCRAADLRYHQSLVSGGPAAASRLHFIYTIPGAPLAEASILLGHRGPGLAFCDGPERARDEARALVERGRVRAAVALYVEAPEGPVQAEATLFRPV